MWKTYQKLICLTSGMESKKFPDASYICKFCFDRDLFVRSTCLKLNHRPSIHCLDKEVAVFEHSHLPPRQMWMRFERRWLRKRGGCVAQGCLGIHSVIDILHNINIPKKTPSFLLSTQRPGINHNDLTTKASNLKRSKNTTSPVDFTPCNERNTGSTVRPRCWTNRPRLYVWAQCALPLWCALYWRQRPLQRPGWCFWRIFVFLESSKAFFIIFSWELLFVTLDFFLVCFVYLEFPSHIPSEKVLPNPMMCMKPFEYIG